MTETDSSDARGRLVLLAGRLRRLLGHPAILPAMLLAGAIFVGFVVTTVASGRTFVAYDAQAYWLAARSDDPYASAIEHGFDDTSNPFTYRYPPPLIQVLRPIASVLPLPVFVGLWAAGLYLVFLWLARRWAFPLLLLFPAVMAELWLGNVNLLVAAVVVIGFRWPALWAFVVLTKVSSGIGVLWFVFRREWRQAALAVLATGAVALVSYLLAPGLWSDFLAATLAQADAVLTPPALGLQVGLPLRLGLSIAIIWFAARTDRPWLLPVAVVAASPVIWFNVLVILAASVPLAERPSIWLPASKRHEPSIPLAEPA